MNLQLELTYIDPRDGTQVIIESQNTNGTFNSDTGDTFKPDGEWAGGGWWLDEMELPQYEGFTPSDKYVSMLEAIVGNEAVTKIRELLK